MIDILPGMKRVCTTTWRQRYSINNQVENIIKFNLKTSNESKSKYKSFGICVLAMSLAILYENTRDGESKAAAPFFTNNESIVGVKQYPANKPIEDRCHTARLSHGEWWFSVFDGHGGWQCSQYASKKLYENVEIELNNHLGHLSTNEDGSFAGEIDRKIVSKALKSAFERTDRQYMTKVVGAFELGFGLNTRAGSCGLGALVLDGTLYVANAGDSRAVLGVNRAGSMSDKKPRLAGRRPSYHGDAEADNDLLLSMDELMGQAALKDSIGEELDPKVAEALRSKLMSQIYMMRQHKYGDDDDEDSEILSMPSLPTPPHRNLHNALNHTEPNQKSFVGVVRMITGGDVHKTSPGDGASKYLAIEMSNDHNCREQRERASLEMQHPGESDVVVCRPDKPDQCYIKGKLQPTRAFGDFYLKYSEFMRLSHEDPAAGRYVPPPYTPPYITATPEIQVRTLQTGIDKFLILASDGLWDMISSQEAVDIVGECLKNSGATVTDASEMLIEEALKRAAKMSAMPLPQLKSLKPGRARRTKHDDISVLVIDLEHLTEMDMWG